MLDERMYALGEEPWIYLLGSEPNKIRELFQYGLERKKEIGCDKVFDYSIGNPSIPAPKKVSEVLHKLADEDPVELHGYTPSPGALDTRVIVAEHIRRVHGIPAKARHVYISTAASSGIAITLAALTSPGDEVMVITPSFPEYAVWAKTAYCSIVEVPSEMPSFQPDIEAMEAAMTPKTGCVIINSPNNPVGVVYTREKLEALFDMMRRKEEEYGHPIFLLTDEPYREITYGKEIPYIPPMYEHTVVCYSWSKSLSLPGERIGYIYVSDLMSEALADKAFACVCGAGRAMGYICAPATSQRIVQECIDEPSDITQYAQNRDLIKGIMDRCGFEYVEPDGAFYLWVKAPYGDDIEFMERAKEHEILIVPSSTFHGAPGWARLSYCIDPQTIKCSEHAFAALMEDYKNGTHTKNDCGCGMLA